MPAIHEIEREYFVVQNKGKSRKRLQKRPLGPTLQDVADEADVSTATVSRYFNSPESVRLELRQRVERVVQRLGYVPHGAARALASQRMHTIGAIFPSLDNLIFATAAQAMQERLDPVGYTLLLANSGYNETRELRQLQSLMIRGLDGVVLVGEERAQPVYDLIARKQIPYLDTWVYRPESPHPTLGFDNASASRSLLQYLVDIGHRRIGMIAGIRAGNDRAAARVRGVETGLAANGLALADDAFQEVKYTISAGRAALRRIREAAPDVTAVLCGNDILALGALFECHTLGIDVPGELSVTGFDDLEISKEMAPALTTVHVPAAAIGARAADHLLRQIDGDEPGHAVRLNADLVVRGSCAPPRRASRP